MRKPTDQKVHIELIGCTSAGKSTLTGRILQGCQELGIEINTGDEFVLSQIWLNWVGGHVIRTLLVDFAALVACLISWRKHIEFYRFVTRLLFRLPIARLERLNLLRNVFKKIGIHEIIRFRSSDGQVVLVDEGVLQAAHNLFVHGSVEVKKEYLNTFAKLIPLPDVAVYLRQPESLLASRTMKRGHKRIPDRSRANVLPFIRQAVATFDNLVQNPVLQNRLLIVDGSRGFNMVASNQHNGLVGHAYEIIEKGIATGANTSPTKVVHDQMGQPLELGSGPEPLI